MNLFNENHQKRLSRPCICSPRPSSLIWGKDVRDTPLNCLSEQIFVLQGRMPLSSLIFLSKGLCPSAGGIVQLQKIVGYSIAKFWILSSHKLSKKEIKYSPFIHEAYKNDRKKCLKEILVSINETAPVARVQAKRSFFESLMYGLERADSKEGDFARAAHLCEDWKNPTGKVKATQNPKTSLP